MTPRESCFEIENFSTCFEPPILIVSTVVGRGMYSIGEAIQERLTVLGDVYHIPIEEFVSPNVVNEDLKRYKSISNNFPFLLYFVYKIPLFYYRKYLREKLFNSADLQKLRQKIESLQIKTVICISHRPAFWVSSLKRRERLGISVWGVLGEYGKNLGWKYQFWEHLNGFLSCVDREDLGFPLSPQVIFHKIRLPARQEYTEISATKGDKNRVLLVCGFWGQGPLLEILRQLSDAFPDLKIDAVCGENRGAYEKICRSFCNNSNVQAYGVADSLAPFLRKSASVITKPGISTLLESRASQRKIFLLKGMPVAEDNNARFAIHHFDAQWFDIGAFKNWYASNEA
jgi:UDP-N-acetylglucosamine:LPS N-acetylglucosamine transferase